MPLPKGEAWIEWRNFLTGTSDEKLLIYLSIIIFLKRDCDIGKWTNRWTTRNRLSSQLKLTFDVLHRADHSSMHFVFNAQYCARNAARIVRSSPKRNLDFKASKTDCRHIISSHAIDLTRNFAQFPRIATGIARSFVPNILANITVATVKRREESGRLCDARRRRRGDSYRLSPLEKESALFLYLQLPLSLPPALYSGSKPSIRWLRALGRV